MIFERRRFVVTMGVIVQEKEKVENGLVFGESSSKMLMASVFSSVVTN